VPFVTKAALDGAYPNGPFSLSFNATNDGPKNLPLVVTADMYPNPPHVNNWLAAQLVDANTGLNVNWDPLAEGNAHDFIRLTVRDAGNHLAFQTPGFGRAGALDGLAASVLIPAGTLNSNQVYSAELLFRKTTLVDTNSYPGATGLAGYSAATLFRVLTMGSGNPPVLHLAASPAAQAYQLSAQVLPGIPYRVEGSTNLLQWFSLTTNVTTNPSFEWMDPVQRGAFFYRLRVLP
jgi:hypothetical protein